ncbi:MAG TPA: hypothetical protein PKW70_02900 [Candidatus Pacearchaeota archaeon]|nr:hypothetical protein [Candidatus Pacearchaeota archaeon]HPJ86718.1 hypothetical protein [Candidatus Pacearchaeota archaeon]
MDDEGFWDDEYERFWEQEFRKLDFSPAGRRLEHKIAELYQKEISKLDASDKKKKELTDMIKDYILCYEMEYARYYQAFVFYGLPYPELN